MSAASRIQSDSADRNDVALNGDGAAARPPDNGRPMSDNEATRDLIRGAVSDDAPEYDYANYRAISPAAIGSLVFGLASVSAFINWWLVVIPIAGVLLAIFALRQISERSDELTGRPFALAGLALSAACAVGGHATLWHEYLTEVPEGHVRLTYDDLQPDERVPGQVVPATIHDQDGKRVFIKGYVLAGTRREGIQTFILVRDQGDCCFGGNPKLTDRILVQLKPGRVFSYTDRRQKIIGEFHVRAGKAVDVPGDVVYQLQDAEIL
jgi:hypothetical protein